MPPARGALVCPARGVGRPRGGQRGAQKVVATAGCIPNKTTPCSFNGTYRDVVRWPVRSVGIRLTFQATVKTKLGTKNLNWWIKVRR